MLDSQGFVFFDTTSNYVMITAMMTIIELSIPVKTLTTSNEFLVLNLGFLYLFFILL